MLKQNDFRFLIIVTLLMMTFVINPVTVGASNDDSTDDSISVSSDGEEEKVVNNTNESKNKDKVSKSFEGSGKKIPFRDKTIEQDEDLKFLKPSKIIGSDDRVKINNTTDFPYSAVVYLSVEYPNSSKTYGCTGFLVNDDTVVTAGHCIFNSSRGGWATNVTASPGRNGTSTPYNTYQNKTLYSVKGWTEKGKPEYDYGAIKLDGSPGNITGWFGYRTTNGDLNPTGQTATISGYPDDKTLGTMWKDSDNITDALEYLLLYQIDTYDGQSGAPVYRNYSDTGQTSIAIHTGSLASGPYNRGTRITLDVFDNIDNWKNK